MYASETSLSSSEDIGGSPLQWIMLRKGKLEGGVALLREKRNAESHGPKGPNNSAGSQRMPPFLF